MSTRAKDRFSEMTIARRDMPPSEPDRSQWLVALAKRFMPGDAVFVTEAGELWMFHGEPRDRVPGFNEVAEWWMRRDAERGEHPDRVSLHIARNDGSVGVYDAHVEWEPMLYGVGVSAP